MNKRAGWLIRAIPILAAFSLLFIVSGEVASTAQNLFLSA
jgi:hypothetical protein